MDIALTRTRYARAALSPSTGLGQAREGEGRSLEHFSFAYTEPLVLASHLDARLRGHDVMSAEPFPSPTGPCPRLLEGSGHPGPGSREQCPYPHW